MGLRCFFGLHNWGKVFKAGNQHKRIEIRNCADCSAREEKVVK